MSDTLERLHERVAAALEAAYEQMRLAQDAELALRNYETALRHDFNIAGCRSDLAAALASLDAAGGAER